MLRKDWDVTDVLARSRRAQRRAMLRDLEAMSRRELLRRGGRLAAGGAASALFAAGIPLGGGAWARQETPALPEVTEIPENLKGSGEVVVCSFGGAFQEAQRNAYFIPFQELSGITVVEAEGPDLSKVKAMVDTGNIEWDVVEFDRSDIVNLEKQGDYWEEIDQSLFDTANIDASHFYKYSVDMLPYGTVIAYRTDAFPTAPAGQKDFWDLENFPGPRSMQSGSGGLIPDLEFAVIADGVPMDELYPLDIDRAYNSMSKIRDSVVKFWETGAQPAQMLTDNEAVMVHAWNGRIDAIQREGAPVAIQWNEGKIATDVWAIPKGSPNATNAQKFTAFITLPAPQARLSMLIPYSFVNNKAAELIPADRLEQLPLAIKARSKMFDRDVEWWIENRDAVLERWNEWLLE